MQICVCMKNLEEDISQDTFEIELFIQKRDDIKSLTLDYYQKRLNVLYVFNVNKS